VQFTSRPPVQAELSAAVLGIHPIQINCQAQFVRLVGDTVGLLAAPTSVVKSATWRTLVLKSISAVSTCWATCLFSSDSAWRLWRNRDQRCERLRECVRVEDRKVGLDHAREVAVGRPGFTVRKSCNSG